jgi:hypothetical protein
MVAWKPVKPYAFVLRHHENSLIVPAWDRESFSSRPKAGWAQAGGGGGVCLTSMGMLAWDRSSKAMSIE